MKVQLGPRIRARRKALGIPVDDLAQSVGVSRATMYRYEVGTAQPPATILQPLAQALDTTPEALMDWPMPHPDLVPLDTLRVPILGDVACGDPIYAPDPFESYVQLGTAVKCDFALRAKGESMTGIGIHDGCLVLIRNQADVRDGEVAAVSLDGEATLKRVRRVRGGLTLLLAENPAYPPIVVGSPGETRDVRILGKAVAFLSDIV
ncbi:MAG: helix-turn-helix domain-containing protein [Oscillospiraceae bacterium]|jgi:repressor LexA|nr:helix-turn-helix domain-containing protein [Oscillospiraceae bacterium]